MYNVLVSGVGGVIGYGVVRALKQSGYETNVIGVDIYDDAVGQNWCDRFQLAVPVRDPGYADFLRRICSEHDIHLFIPVVVQEVERLGQEPDILAGLASKIALNQPPLIAVSYDKWTMHLELIKHQLPVIDSAIDGTFAELSARLGCPFLLKPRRSYGSKGICEITNEDDLLYWAKKLGDNFMVQRIVGNAGSEYTASVFGYGDGSSSTAIILRRRLGPDGSTAKATVVSPGESDYAPLDTFISRLVEIYLPIGPTNFQFRMEGANAFLLEVNPRVSSATSIRAAFGYNEAKMCLQYYLEAIRCQPDEIKKGQAARYLEDVIAYARHNF